MNNYTKQTGKQRRASWRATWKTVNIPRTAPKDWAVRLSEKCYNLSANGLVRLIKRSARRAAYAKYILAKMHPDSQFHPPIDSDRNRAIITAVAARQELHNRANHEIANTENV